MKIDRPLEDEPELRELIASYGDTGYIALYNAFRQTTTVFLHQQEARDWKLGTFD